VEKQLTAHDEDLKNLFIIFKKLVQDPIQVKRNPIGFPYPNKK